MILFISQVFSLQPQNIVNSVAICHAFISLHTRMTSVKQDTFNRSIKTTCVKILKMNERNTCSRRDNNIDHIQVLSLIYT